MAEKATTAQQERFHFLATADLTKHYRALHELATGVHFEGCSECTKPVEECQCKKTTLVRIYSRAPDRQALMFLIEQGIGKATQKTDVVRDTEITITHSVPRPGRQSIGNSGEAAETDALEEDAAGAEEAEGGSVLDEISE